MALTRWLRGTSRQGWIIVGGPLLLSPWLLSSGSSALSQPATRCAAATLLMALFWASEALPLAVTALLPFAMFPLLGIRSSADTAATFFTDTQFLNLGGQMIAVAIEEQNLHTRIALRVLLVVGTAPRRLLLGFMLACAFLSMWMSNTATAGMMMPIARTLLATISTRTSSADAEAVRRYRQGVLLGVAYGCSVGGIATLTGTPANIILAGFVSEQYPEFGSVSFTGWLVCMLPLALILLVAVWAILCFAFVDSGLRPVERRVLIQEHSSLGSPQFGERLIGLHFIILIVLWLTRAPPPPLIGWNVLFEQGFISDSTAAMTVALSLFVTPAAKPRSGKWSLAEYKRGPKLLSWEAAVRGIPWPVVVILAGGYALADAISGSGLSAAVGCQLLGLRGWAMPTVQLVVILGINFATNWTSNAATTIVAMPIVAALAGNLHVNPMLLLVPAALSTSFAFMLPIATPPNAIVFSSGELKVIDMLKPGAVANVVCSVALWAYFQLLAPSGDGESPGSSAVLWPLRAVLWGPTLAQFATGEPDWAVTAWEDAAGNETGC